MPPLLELRDLSIAFPGRHGALAAVRGVSLGVAAGEIVGLVGESGAGKSLTALAALGLVPAPGKITGGSIEYCGRDLHGLTEREYRRVRGAGIGLLFQEAGIALNPVFTIGAQIVEAMRAHRRWPATEARRRAVELLRQLAMPDAEAGLDCYPHELSGGQRQRALLAIVLAAEPALLIADEPTTALDVTLQAQVLDLLDSLRRGRGLGVLLITHDLGIVERICDRVFVLYHGEVVEAGPVAEVLRAPSHPYTQGLLSAVPRLADDGARGRLATIPGAPPALGDRFEGCAFHPRCSRRLPQCENVAPSWSDLADGRGVRCWLTAPEGPPQ